MQKGRFVFEQAPGHLIRRAHQISVAAFAEEAAAFDVTPVQFAILDALRDEEGIDQVTLAARVAFDAATIGSVIARLEKKGWLRRRSAENDRRRKLLWMTPLGREAAAQMEQAVVRVQQRILAPLNEAEKRQFMSLIAKMVNDRASDLPLQRPD